MNFNNEQKKSTRKVLQGMVLGGLLLSASFSGGAVAAGGVNLSQPEKQTKEEGVKRVDSGLSKLSTEIPLNLISTAHYSAASYGYKQCTWWAYNRARDFEIYYGEYMGNGADWKAQLGYTISSTPVLHSVIWNNVKYLDRK